MNQVVTRPATLASLVERLRRHPAVAFDMEFERENSYWPRLQLIQVATPEEAAAIDPLALDDLSPIFDLIADPSITKLVHAGRQDAEIVFFRAGKTPAAIFDTQIAAALLGMGEQIGYGPLVQRLLGVHLHKAERITDWSRRPLSTAQLEYALDDVRHLPPLHEKLEGELRERDRLTWLKEEVAFYEDPGVFGADPERMYLRVSGHRSLDRRQLGVLRELARWREEEAAKRDVPRNRVLPDDVLLEVARRKPKRPSDLEPLRRLHPRERERSGDAMVRAVNRALVLPDDELPPVRHAERDEPELAPVAELMGVVLRKRAREVAIAPSYLGTQSDLLDLVDWLATSRDGEPPHLLAGWRRELVGEELVRLFDGKTTLFVDPDSRRVTTQDRG